MSKQHPWNEANEIAKVAIQVAEIACATTDRTQLEVYIGNDLGRAFQGLCLRALQVAEGNPYLNEHSPEVRDLKERLWKRAWNNVNYPMEG